jgi:Domain of unknown function (DUF4304)
MMRMLVAPAIRELGFTGPSRHFRYASGGYSGGIRLQKSRFSSRRRVDFTFHVGAPCMRDQPIVYLMPEQEPPVPYWWRLNAGRPAGPVADSVIAAVRRFGLPAILAGLDEADRELEPDDPMAQPFLGPPPIGPVHDGRGADPAAWYVQPTGSEFDWAFAEFASPASTTRLAGVETVARLAMSDPRAVPALLDRLEHDASPHIRATICYRVLTPLARDERVRPALRTAASEDRDCQTRWAARYALRLDLRDGA